MIIELGWLLHHPRETEVFRLSERLGDLELAGERVRLLKEVDVDLTLTNTGRIIVGRGKIETAAELTCGRCLRPYVWPVSVAFDVQLVEQGAAVPQDMMDSGDVLVIEEQEVDLEPLVIENIIVSLPLARVCRDDCKGFCPGCGADLSREACRCRGQDIDPRWEALKVLLDNKN